MVASSPGAGKPSRSGSGCGRRCRLGRCRRLGRRRRRAHGRRRGPAAGDGRRRVIRQVFKVEVIRQVGHVRYALVVEVDHAARPVAAAGDDVQTIAARVADHDQVVPRLPHLRRQVFRQRQAGLKRLIRRLRAGGRRGGAAHVQGVGKDRTVDFRAAVGQPDRRVVARCLPRGRLRSGGGRRLRGGGRRLRGARSPTPKCPATQKVGDRSIAGAEAQPFLSIINRQDEPTMHGDGDCRALTGAETARRRQRSKQRQLFGAGDGLLQDGSGGHGRCEPLPLAGISIPDFGSDVIGNDERAGVRARRSIRSMLRKLSRTDASITTMAPRVTPRAPPGPGEAACRPRCRASCRVPGRGRGKSLRGDTPRSQDERFRCGVHDPNAGAARVRRRR